MSRYRIGCWRCTGDGVVDGECTCGEDCCVCAEPEPPVCDHCRGKGFLIVSELTDDNCGSAVLIKESDPA